MSWGRFRNDIFAHPHQGQSNNFSDVASHYVPQPTTVEHNSTSSKCSRSRSPSASRDRSINDGQRGHNGGNEPNKKAATREEHVPKSEPDIGVVYEGHVPK
mmetsp:Transcript_30935/g.56068  ORF Transcript_30935/g.56068 Transcript_30935/m.56068 type:complete len:101 (+) Transcript_30935:555-857(+)